MLHVMEMAPGYYPEWTAFLQLADVRSMLRKREHEFDDFLRTEFQDLAVHRIFQSGDPGLVIASYASKHHVDLVMMPSHGVGTFRRLLLGSVTAKVLHDTTLPVWTSAHAEGAASWLRPERYAKILGAVDLTQSSVRVIEYAAGFAQTFGAELKLVHVVPASESLTVKYFDKDFVAALSETAREQITKLQSQAGTDAQVLIRSGDIAHVIQQVALDSQADLIVIGRGALQETLGRLRTKAYSIIRESPCPVLSV
jgi:nucleotide-binding universal stress UspA family protein